MPSSVRLLGLAKESKIHGQPRVHYSQKWVVYFLTGLSIEREMGFSVSVSLNCSYFFFFFKDERQACRIVQKEMGREI